MYLVTCICEEHERLIAELGWLAKMKQCPCSLQFEVNRNSHDRLNTGASNSTRPFVIVWNAPALDGVDWQCSSRGESNGNQFSSGMHALGCGQGWATRKWQRLHDLAGTSLSNSLQVHLDSSLLQDLHERTATASPVTITLQGLVTGHRATWPPGKASMTRADRTGAEQLVACW